jgi:topoisomerase-4 subunit A
MIGRDGRPQQKNLVQILREWIDFRYATVERRTRHRLDEVERRIHILEGRMIAFLHIEEVIRVIRESDEPKPDADGRLRPERDPGRGHPRDPPAPAWRAWKASRSRRSSPSCGPSAPAAASCSTARAAMTKLILKEIQDDAKKYGDDRRTLMEAVAPVSPAEISVPDEPVTVIVSKNGWVRSRQGHGIDPAGITYKAGDFPWLVAETRTVWPLIVIDGNGRSYSVKVSDLPGGRGDGAPINTMVEFQDGGKLAQALTRRRRASILVAGSGGYGFIASVGDMVARNKAGKAFLTLEKANIRCLRHRSSGDTVAVLTQAGRLLLFPLAELKEMAKGKGLMLIDLVKNDEARRRRSNRQSAATDRRQRARRQAREQALDARAQADFRGARARRGQEIPFKLKPSGLDLTGNTMMLESATILACRHPSVDPGAAHGE